MNASVSMLEAIGRRTSYRTYDGQPLEATLAEGLRARLAAPPAAPFGSGVTVDLLTDFDAQQRGVGKLGTYGIIRGARNYLVGRVARGPRAMEDFGYVFEWAILQATCLGLGTCWLGGTLKRSAFGQAVGAGPEQIIPAVSPVGHALARRRTLDRIMRWGAGSDSRKDPAELFFDADFATPAVLADLGPWGRVLELVRLAPSASNKQPWRVVVGPERTRFDLYIQRTPGYGLMPDVDLQRIDAGIAMAHFALAAGELGLDGRFGAEPPAAVDPPARTEFVAAWLC